MTVLTNTAEGGTSGVAVAITPSNNTGAASGNPFDSITVDTGATLQFSNTQKSHGLVSYNVTTTGTKASLQWNTASFTASTMMSARFYVFFTGAPSAAIQIFSGRSASAASLAINHNSFNQFQVADANGTALFTSSTLTNNQWYRVEVSWQPGTVTTGVVNFAYYLADSTTPVQTQFTKTDANLGTANITQVNFGKISTTGNYTAYFDSIKIDTATTTLLGPHTTAVTSVRPNSISSNPGNWAEVGTAGGLPQALADELNTTYITSPQNPSNSQITFGLNGVLDTGAVTVTVKADTDTAGVNATLIVDLMQGSTLIATRTFSMTNTIADYQFTTSSSETAAITNRSLLVVRLTANLV